MNAINPLYIPRNHRIEEAIQNAVDGDFEAFDTLRIVLERPYELHDEFRHLADAPAAGERVLQTFCGT